MKCVCNAAILDSIPVSRTLEKGCDRPVVMKFCKATNNTALEWRNYFENLPLPQWSMGRNTQDDTAVYLVAGDVTAHSMACCANSAMLFPLDMRRENFYFRGSEAAAFHFPEIFLPHSFLLLCPGEFVT